MPRVLISEPDEAVQQRLERLIACLGHEPVAVEKLAPGQLTGADVLLVEPATPLGVVLAQATRLAAPSLPIICSSVAEPSVDLAGLGIQFAAVLVRPYTGEQLGVAIERALAMRCPRRQTTTRRARRVPRRVSASRIRKASR